MRLLLFGASGMLGQALNNEAKLRDYEVITVSRQHGERRVDITDDDSIRQIIYDVRPDLIINAAASVNLKECTDDPGYAYAVNARSVDIMAKTARVVDSYFVHISTDHYFTGHGSEKHNETSQVDLVNEYARTKYAGETFALTNPMSLVVRTNIVGFRGCQQSQTFVEWVIDSLQKQRKITMFKDYFTSSIDVRNFSAILFDLIATKAAGVWNIASSEVSSKKTFIEALATSLEYRLDEVEEGSVVQIKDGIERAESLGLDVSRAESKVGYTFPDLQGVISSLKNEFIEKRHAGHE